MKKLVALLLSIAMIFAFSGCNERKIELNEKNRYNYLKSEYSFQTDSVLTDFRYESGMLMRAAFTKCTLKFSSKNAENKFKDASITVYLQCPPGSNFLEEGQSIYPNTFYPVKSFTVELDKHGEGKISFIVYHCSDRGNPLTAFSTGMKEIFPADIHGTVIVKDN